MMAGEEYRVKFGYYADMFIKRSAKSNHARLAQYRRPNVAWLDLALVSPTALLLTDKS